MLRDTDDADFWDRAARKYASDTIKDMAGYERTLERTRQLLRSSDTVLEVGCGTGNSALKIAASVAKIVGHDLSSEMIAIARERAVAQGCRNADFAVAPAERVVGVDGSFDAVLAFNVLHLVVDRRETLRNARRLLKPGGLFISKTPCLSEMNALLRIAVPVARLVGRAPHVAFFSSLELAREIEAAGFSLIEQSRHGSGRNDARIFLVARTSEDVTKHVRDDNFDQGRATLG